VHRVAVQLGYGTESVRSWVRQADIDEGRTVGTTTGDAARIKALEQEVKELRRTNAILKSASAFFAAELDRPQKR
jgi:transposase-like protein